MELEGKRELYCVRVVSGTLLMRINICILNYPDIMPLISISSRVVHFSAFIMTGSDTMTKQDEGE